MNASVQCRSPFVVVNSRQRRASQSPAPSVRPVQLVARPRLAVAAEGHGGTTRSLTDRLADPLEAVALGPRLALGTATELLALGTGGIPAPGSAAAAVKSQLEELQALLQDPRPPQDKAGDAFKLASEAMAALADRGAVVESDALARLKELLPPEAARLIPVFPNGGTVTPNGGAEETATSGEASPSGPAWVTEPTGPAEAATNRLTGEVSAIRAEVAAVRAALTAYGDALREAAAPGGGSAVAGAPMRAMNLKEAREQLARRLREVGDWDAGEADSGADGAALRAARTEAADFLADVTALSL